MISFVVLLSCCAALSPGLAQNPNSQEELYRCPSHLHYPTYENSVRIFRNKCIEFQCSSKYWGDAATYCERSGRDPVSGLDHGGRLVEIYDQEMQNMLSTTLDSVPLTENYVWIGATDRQAEGAWCWTSGNQLNYTRWARGEPDTSILGDWQDCAAMHRNSQWRWKDRQCTFHSLKYNFICQYNMAPAGARPTASPWTPWDSWWWNSPTPAFPRISFPTEPPTFLPATRRRQQPIIPPWPRAPSAAPAVPPCPDTSDPAERLGDDSGDVIVISINLLIGLAVLGVLLILVLVALLLALCYRVTRAKRSSSQQSTAGVGRHATEFSEVDNSMYIHVPAHPRADYVVGIDDIKYSSKKTFSKDPPTYMERVPPPIKGSVYKKTSKKRAISRKRSK